MSDNIDEIDPTFVVDLLGSKPSVEAVANYFRKKGYTVEVPEIVVRPDPSVRHLYTDRGDVLVTFTDHQARIEVKGRKDQFTGRFSYKRNDVLIDTAFKFDKKNPTPLMYFATNHDNTVAIVIPVNTREHWRKKDVFAKGRTQECYFVGIEHCYFVRLSEIV